MNKKEAIDFEKYETGDQFVTFKAGKPKNLLFVGWESGTKTLPEKKDKEGNITQKEKELECVIFTVKEIEINVLSSGKIEILKESEPKIYKATSKRLIAGLKEHLEKGRDFAARVTQYGSGFDIEWDVTPLVIS